MSEEPCPVCGAPKRLVWVHGHAQCMNCATPIVDCCTGAGQELDENSFADCTIGVDEVLDAFERCADGAAAVTLEALLIAISQHEDCTQEAARTAVERAVSLHRLALTDRVVRRHA